mgnify:FL=1
MYVRRKNVKGFSYAYLVESRWDKEKKQSYQVVIKYLGRFENLKLDKLTSEELAVVGKYMNTKLQVSGNMDSHIRKYQQLTNKNKNKMIKRKLVEQRKIEKVQEKVLSDLKMDKRQFSDRFGWKNTLSNSIKMDITV